MNFTRAYISLFIFSLSFTFSFAQLCDNQRYRDSVFAVEKHADIIFANVQALTAVYVSEDVTVSQDLFMDIFEPAGDTLSKRPLVVFAFGGGFLIGGKDDEDAQTYCDSLAHTGYVTASIQYRLGMNIASNESSVRAIYRAAQDYSAAVRYLKEYAWQYRIDTNFVFTGGVSAGSFSAMNLAYMQDADRPQETYTTGGLIPAPDLGCINCSGNIYHHSTKAKALVNCWGALLDTSWMDMDDNTPLISFHGDADPVVPYATGFPFTALFLMPTVYGSQPITERANHIGLYNRLHPFAGQGHNAWGTVVNNSFVGGQTPYFDTVFQETKEFLYPFLQPSLPVITGSSDVCVGDTIVYSVTQNQGSAYCWEVQGGIIVSQFTNINNVSVLWQNTGYGSVKAREINHLLALSDATLMEVNISDCVTGINNAAGHSQYLIFPNPVKSGEQVTISMEVKRQGKIIVSDLTGRTVLTETFTGIYSLNTSSFREGFYTISISGSEEIKKSFKLIVY